MTEMWVTKYALTTGIKKYKGTLAYGEFFSVQRVGLFRAGKDAHETLETALLVAEKARTAKIKSLKKQIERLEAMQFKET